MQKQLLELDDTGLNSHSRANAYKLKVLDTVAMISIMENEVVVVIAAKHVLGLKLIAAFNPCEGDSNIEPSLYGQEEKSTCKLWHLFVSMNSRIHPDGNKKLPKLRDNPGPCPTPNIHIIENAKLDGLQFMDADVVISYIRSVCW